MIEEAKGYFVTIKRGHQIGALLGPYASYDEAAGHVDRARKLASDADPWADFDAFGVTAIPASEIARRKIRAVFSHLPVDSGT